MTDPGGEDLGAPRLDRLASEFLVDRQDLLDRLLPLKPGADETSRRIVVQRHKGAHVARLGYAPDNKRAPFPLLQGGEHTGAGLVVEYGLTLDHVHRHLAVRESRFGLFVGRHPLFHLDFRGDMKTAPSAHWNVHGERAAVTRLLVLGNRKSNGELGSLHFPVGGARMRPCLEDFLEVLATEFAVDLSGDWRAVLAEGREHWRRIQVAALVRDVPEVAAGVLRDHFGYTVTEPDDSAEGREGWRRDRTLRRC